MPFDVNSLFEVVVIALVFGLVLALWLVGAVLWISRQKARSRRVDERLGIIEPHKDRTLRLWKDGQEATTTVPGLRKVFWLARLDQHFHQAGWEAPLPTILLGASGAAAALFVAIYSLSNNVLLAASGVFLLFFFLRMHVRRCLMKRLLRFESQFIEALDLAARSLRAGHPLMGAFAVIAEEVQPPVGEAFLEICQRQSLGEPLEAAIQNAAAISGSADMSLFATSVSIQLRTGGNLADMMERLAAVIRDRLRLNRRVRVLTAQTQLSKRILIGLPIVLFIALNIINPGYMEPIYTTNGGRMLLLIASSGVLLGMWVMNRLTVLRY